MWVTQTYLGKVEPDAKLFVYYLFEDYNSQQKEFSELVQHHLEHLGEVYGESVSLMMPNPRYSGRIEAEVREFPKLWMAVREMLPGLLLSPLPLTELAKSMRNCKFIPFMGQDPRNVARVIQLVRGYANNAATDPKVELPSDSRRSFFSRFAEAVEVKPGIWGVSLDLKKLSGP